MTIPTIENAAAFTEAGVEPNTLAWLDWRRHAGLGGSDAPGWTGLSPYTSPRDVYLSKTSDLITDEQTEAMQFGHLLEPVIIGEVARRHSNPDDDRHRYLGQIVPGAAVESTRHPHLFASFDALVIEADGIGYPLNAKNVSPYSRGSWDDAELGVPDHVAVQIYHEAIVAGVDHGYAAPFFGNRLPEPIRLDVPPDFAEWYVDAAPAWYEHHVVAGIEPAPTHIDDLNSVWNAVVGQQHVFTDTELLQLDEILDVRERLAILNARHDELKLALQTALGEATEGFDPRGPEPRVAVTWRPEKLPRAKFHRDELLADHPEVRDLLDAYTRREGAPVRKTLFK